jgi:uncharacterized protein (UPF0264 family)
MTFMLASVSGAEDVEVAVRPGADIIDVKNADGAFGAIASSAIRATDRLDGASEASIDATPLKLAAHAGVFRTPPPMPCR